MVALCLNNFYVLCWLPFDQEYISEFRSHMKPVWSKPNILKRSHCSCWIYCEPKALKLKASTLLLSLSLHGNQGFQPQRSELQQLCTLERISLDKSFISIIIKYSSSNLPIWILVGSWYIFYDPIWTDSNYIYLCILATFSMEVKKLPMFFF